MGTCYDNKPCLACGKTLLNKRMWNDIPGQGGTCNKSCQYMILISNWIRKETPIKAAWRRAMQQLDSSISKEIRKIKNNPPESIELDWNPEPVINFLDPEQFHEHYQELAPTREEQEQWLEKLNIRLCQYCLIPSNFEYCNKCDLMYNPLIHIIYTIPEEEEPISSCTSESELSFDPNSNSDNDDNENTGSSSIQYDNNDNNNSNSDSNFDLKYEQYITIPDLTKEQELK
ncbi:hypothetical protein G9A89_020731 [Geosiphon pyriformis]|nr:hypothetical protein G9A89_020731 [Geosiphon pyriformis]